MSSLWTPGGEQPVGRAGDHPEHEEPHGEAMSSADQAALHEELAAMQAELARTPAEVVIANHAVGLFQLAAIHLNQNPPNLDDGRLAIDAMAALVEGMVGRLGEAEESLLDALSQVRLAYVSLQEGSG